MLRGECVNLRAPGLDDADIMTAWLNDREVAGLLAVNPLPIPKKSQEEYIMRTWETKNEIIFIIENDDAIPIGIASLTNIDWINSTAEINIVIYAKNCWEKGFGYCALKTLTYHGMYNMNIHTLYANILEGNERAVKCFQKTGYEIEGTLYHRVYKEGRYCNLLSMSIYKAKDQEGEH